MRRSFERWVDSLDPAVRLSNQEPRGWILSTLIAIGVSAIAAFMPGARDFFGLDFTTAMLCLVPGVLFGVTTNAWDRRVGYSRLGYGIVVWIGSLLVQFFTSALVALSHPPGSFVMGAMSILVAGVHGQIYRAAPRTPFIAIATVLGITGAYALAPSPEARAVFEFVCPAAVGAALLLGMHTQADDRERVREAALRAAIQAQVLETRASELQRISTALLGVLQRNHDASNALTTSLLAADFLVDVTRVRANDEAHDVAIQLRAALVRLKQLVDETRQLGRSEMPASESEMLAVAPMPLARRVASEVADRFPTVKITCHAADARSGTVAAAIYGGEETLHRILENVLLNACQGDGASGASRIEVFVRDAPFVGALAVQVIDDGPGFSVADLDRPIEAFATTKPGGSGLGLYTAERLARASGGSLHRANGSGGGAVVTLYFAEADAA